MQASGIVSRRVPSESAVKYSSPIYCNTIHSRSMGWMISLVIMLLSCRWSSGQDMWFCGIGVANSKSLPSMPQWLGTQQKRTHGPLSLSAQGRFMIWQMRGFSVSSPSMNILATFENDPRKITDVRGLNVLVWSADRPTAPTCSGDGNTHEPLRDARTEFKYCYPVRNLLIYCLIE